MTSTTGPRRRRKGMSEQAATAAIDQACRSLRLPTVRGSVEDMVTAAEHEQQSYRGFLAELLLSECDDRDRRRSARRVKAAGFPREKWIEDFDFGANPNINPATVNTLASGAWIKAGEPLCLIGDSGTGKSHLLIGLGTAAALTDPRLCAAIIDRLTFAGNILETGTTSYRLAHARSATAH
ncbi:ATP-binding protein [Saccharopolyspora sp. K220]|uniref:ATP-binding protein n=1 Tax=Saccharopolyspora soli TaxID=2926618 RepID=UPI001F58D0EC|nr:ATP-binding protein [Saccharopolyspora soli]MCI2424157.1 ATP-binding protein [Saccharopolyspora soli]